MEFRSSVVMAYVLNKGQQGGRLLTKTQAQKILYCCYGIIMARFNERLTDEHPKAWPYGPVFPRTLNDINKGRLTVEMAQEFREKCPKDWREWIDLTIRTFWGYTATQLSNWSHMAGSPWTKADPLTALDDREIGIFFKPYLDVVSTRGRE